MNASLNIVQATMEHLDDAAALFDDYRQFYHQQTDIEGARQFLFERLSNRESVIFLVKDTTADKFIGFTQLYPVFSSLSMQRSWILNDLYVAESYRRRGAAQLLLDAARVHAILTKSKGLELATAMDNVKAQTLYEKNGYQRDDAFYHYGLNV